MHSPDPKQALQSSDVQTTTKPCRRRDVLTTGFVFFNEKTQQPRAFLNRLSRCPHALLELDFDDSDFFSEGFIHCKAHAAYFDPETGICLQGPLSSRKKALRGLAELQVVIDGNDIVLLTEQVDDGMSSVASHTNQELEAYKREKQQILAEALSSQSDVKDVEEMQQKLHEKTMARLKHYEQIDEAVRNIQR